VGSVYASKNDRQSKEAINLDQKVLSLFLIVISDLILLLKAGVSSNFSLRLSS
jgi:hypothetical protein